MPAVPWRTSAGAARGTLAAAEGTWLAGRTSRRARARSRPWVASGCSSSVPGWPTWRRCAPTEARACTPCAQTSCAAGCWCSSVRPPKRRDLHRDGRLALHSFPLPDRDDEFYLTGRAEHREAAGLAAEMLAEQKQLGVTSSGDEHLFELLIERALYSRYKPRGEPDNWPPEYLKWVAEESDA